MRAGNLATHPPNAAKANDVSFKVMSDRASEQESSRRDARVERVAAACMRGVA